MGSKTFDGVRFSAWTDDHLPPHIHAFYAGIAVILELDFSKWEIRLARRRDRIQPADAKRSDVSHIRQTAQKYRQDLFKLWEVARGWRMKDIKVSISDEDIDAALEDAKSLPELPRAVSADYVGGKADVVIIRLNTGGRLTIPREELQGLENATEAQLSEIQLWGGGISMSWPQLDVDHYLPHLLEHRYGSDAWMENLRLKGVAA